MLRDVYKVTQTSAHANTSTDTLPGQLTKSLSHALVHVDSVCVLHELSDNLPLIILHHQHLLWFRHSTDHHQTNLHKRSRGQTHNL